MNKLAFNIITPAFKAYQGDQTYFIQVVSLLLIFSAVVVSPLHAQPAFHNQSTPTKTRSNVAVSTGHYPLQDGIHLFGQAQTPNQIQTEYLVFKMTQNRVIGAFFMPLSAFDCFSGSQDAGKLKLQVVESYEQRTFDHSINLNQYYPITHISDNDLRILDRCTVPSNHTAQEP